jgi:hypothetical protein
MKKLSLLLIVAGIVFGCQTAEKPKTSEPEVKTDTTSTKTPISLTPLNRKKKPKKKQQTRPSLSKPNWLSRPTSRRKLTPTTGWTVKNR